MAEDGKTFEASGQMQNPEDTQFDVTPNIYIGIHMRMETIWSIEHTMEGDNISYDLHYVALSHRVSPSAVVL